MNTRDAGSQPSVAIGARGISKRYGPIQANIDISFSVARGEIRAVVGENGAGKSTLMRILQGLERPDAGMIIRNDVELHLEGPHQALELGIGMVHQEFMLAPDLTLIENLVLGAEPIERKGVLRFIDWKSALREASAMATQSGVEIDWTRRAASTPVHVLQYVEIFRLLRRGSSVLILDEPTAVLAPQQVERLFDLLRQLARGGTSIILISHKLHEVRALADSVTIIRRGRVVADGPIAEMPIEAMAKHIVGESIQPKATRTPGSTAAAKGVVLEVREVSAPSRDRSQAIQTISLEVGAGEIVGVAGVAGNGQEELIECICGLRKPSSGSIRISGKETGGLGNMAFRAAGAAYVSPDRAHEGLARAASIEANVMAGSQRLPQFMAGPFLKLKAMRDAARQRLDGLDVRYDGIGNPAQSLSGGNQQKLVFARETAGNPRLLVVSQPTRGVDIKGIAAIHDILRRFRNAGGAVLLASEELEELIQLSDRIMVVADGRISGTLPASEATPQALGLLMLAHRRNEVAANA